MSRLAPSLQRLLDQPSDVRKIGPFVLVRQLGQGGFAPVWLAKEMYGATELRHVALKLFALGPRGGTQRARIVEEARVLCQVEHPNVVRFYSLASDEQNGVIGVAMEHLGGNSLEDRLETSGKRPMGEALEIGASVASALAAVHRAGLLHRDVKPSNIIDSNGVYKLIDFGIASAERVAAEPASEAPVLKQVLVDDLPLRMAPEARRRISGAITLNTGSSGSTTLGRRSGTVGYVDPACVGGDAVPTAASDLWALGVVLFEALTGYHPAVWASGEAGGMAADVLSGKSPCPSLRDVAPEMPAALVELIDGLLRSSPADRPKSAEWVSIELERIRAEASGGRRDLPPESLGPFRGLARFEEADRDVYFGRSGEIATALELCRRNGAIALLGPSGSGKSSLARAGLLPRVADGALGPWPTAWDPIVVVPGVDPRGAILAALDALAGWTPPAELTPRELLLALTERVQLTSRGLVLLIDQAEELATLSLPESRAWTAELVAAIAETPRPGLRVIMAARRDLLDPLLAVGGLGKTLVRSSLLVEPLSDATWSDVLEQALAVYGYELEDEAFHTELVDQLRGTASAMPLVQFALTELWNKRDKDRRMLTRAGLAAIGGISGALERHAETTVAQLVNRLADAEKLIQNILLALTTPQGTRATRAKTTLAPAQHPERAEVLAALERARLVVQTPDGFTLAHEALLTQWERLRNWAAEARDDRELAEELERDAERRRSAPDVVPLWTGRRLAMAEDLERRGVALDPEATSFLRTSRRASRRSRVVASVVGGLALLGAVTAGGEYVRAVRVNEQTALEKASVEQQKAEIEGQKRHDLEAAQAEIDQRQREIDELVGKLALAPDQSAAGALKDQIAIAHESAQAARTRIEIAPPAAAAPPPAEPPASPPPSDDPDAVPMFKVQR